MADKKKKKTTATTANGEGGEPTGEGALKAGFQELPPKVASEVVSPADLPADIDDQINALHMEEGAKKQAAPVVVDHTPERIAKDDATLAAMTAELDTFEATYGPVNVTVADSVAAGNCESGVIAWRAANAGGRVTIPAREMLAAAAESRDQISRVVLGIRRAMKRMGG